MLPGTLAALAGLALAAFAAATPLPFQSEPVFLALLATKAAPLTLILLTASLFNTAGSALTWGLARAAADAGDGRWLPLKGTARARAEGWFARWGLWSLLLCWAPGGDLLVILAGLARSPALATLALIAFAKTARYAALAALATTLVQGWT